MMTIERAKEILATYKMPMPPKMLKEYKLALSLATNNWGKLTT